MVIEHAPLEDELGDVLDKGLRHAGLTEAALAARTGVELSRIRDAIDYRYDLSPEEVGRIAACLGLNEVGLAAMAGSRYPLPAIAGLPCCLFPLRTRHGIGVANAYIVADCCSASGILIDTGADFEEVDELWPRRIRRIEAVFVTHGETEHLGALDGILAARGPAAVFGPAGLGRPGVGELSEGAKVTFAGFEVEVLATPGHAEAHNCYAVRATKGCRTPSGPALLFSGDLLFAGSIGGAYFCGRSLFEHLGRLLERFPDSTVVAPGHGPLTTVGHEKRFNPLLGRILQSPAGRA